MTEGKIYKIDDHKIQSQPEKDIIDFNKDHAVLLVGSKCLVMAEIEEPTFNRKTFIFLDVKDFHNLYANRYCKIKGNNEKVRYEKLSHIWFNSKLRRQYDGVCNNPNGETKKNFLNLYRGLAVKPKKGDCSLYLEHIRNVIANNDRGLYEYIMAWMARIVQDPGGRRPGVALVLRGDQGTGKGLFVKFFGRIFGRHFLHISSQRALTGRFNSHLADALLIFCDEAIWAGDKAAEGALKALITEDIHMVESKFKDPITVKNHTNLIIASNNDWVIPAGAAERRFLVLDIPNIRQQDHDYFKALVGQMENGGTEALLDKLNRIDYSEVDLRKFPKTRALIEQIEKSMTAIQRYWYEKLNNGYLIRENEGWSLEISTEVLYKDYIEFTQRVNERRYNYSQPQFGKELKKLVPEIVRRKRKVTGRMNDTQYCYSIPDLKICRKAFEKIFKVNFNWGS